MELKENELSLAHVEVARAEAARSVTSSVLDASQLQLQGGGGGPMDEALRSLQEDERALLSRLGSNSEARALFEAFLSRKRELEEEEVRACSALILRVYLLIGR